MGQEPLQGARRHKLLPADIRKALPELYSTDGNEQALCPLKLFCPYSGWTWYLCEFDGEDTFFGYTIGHEAEWGYVSYSELAEAASKSGVPFVERDLSYKPVTKQTVGLLRVGGRL